MSEGTSRGVSWARRVGLIAGPVLAVLAYALLPREVESGGLTHGARAVAAVAALMAVYWMTEALPLAATSLLPLVMFPALGVMDVGGAAAPYADRVIFLFMGGFMLAAAVERWGLHRRLALMTVLAVGARQTRLVGGFMAATAFLSMWLSNTATAAMMLPIGMSLVTLARERAGAPEGEAAGASPFGAAMMLGIAYAASLGGMATPIGTPPNAILVGYLSKQGIQIGFAEWMAFGAPLAAVFTVIAWALLAHVLHPLRGRSIEGGRELMRAEAAKLGRMGRGEWAALGVFSLAATLWIARSVLKTFPEAGGVAGAARNTLNALDDAGIAMGCALLLFAIPVRPSRGEFALDWRAASRLPWDVLLLFGGGLSLAAAMEATGFDGWIGVRLAGVGALPAVGIVAVICVVVVLLGELASNTATAATFIPIVGGVAVGAGFDVLELTLPAALAASCGFMLPVATPPNAIAFGTGQIRMGQMVRAGVALDVLGIALVTATALVVGAVW